MPIDSAAKRRSASGVGHRVGGRGVTPNAAKPTAWRQQAGWGYSGIAAGGTPTPAVGRRFSVSGRGTGRYTATGRGTGGFAVPGDDGDGQAS